MYVYLYFCIACGVLAVGVLIGTIVDYIMEKRRYRSKHDRRNTK